MRSSEKDRIFFYFRGSPHWSLCGDSGIDFALHGFGAKFQGLASLRGDPIDFLPTSEKTSPLIMIGHVAGDELPSDGAAHVLRLPISEVDMSLHVLEDFRP